MYLKDVFCSRWRVSYNLPELAVEDLPPLSVWASCIVYDDAAIFFAFFTRLGFLGRFIQHLFAASQVIPYIQFDDVFLYGLCAEKAELKVSPI